MATYTWTRNAVDSKMVSASSVNYNALYISTKSDQYFLWQMEDAPAAYRQKRITSADIYLYGYSDPTPEGYDNAAVVKYIKDDDFSPIASATYQDLQAVSKYGYESVYLRQYGAWMSSENIQTAYGRAPVLFAYSEYKADGRIYGPKSDYAPYIVANLQDIEVYPRNCSPSSGYVNEKVANTFRWQAYARYDGLVEDPTQASAKFEWRVAGASAVQSVTINSGTTSVTVPANTFPQNGSIQWRVTITSTDGIVSNPSAWYTLTTTDSTSMSVTPLSPVSTYLDGTQPQTFRWRYSIDTGTAPSGYRLQYSSDNGATWTMFAQGTGEAQTVTVSANTFPAQSILWRVAAANSDGVWSAYSAPANVIVVSAPPQPALSIDTATARPVFNWQSEGQVAYRLWAVDNEGNLVFDTGSVYGTGKTYQSPDFLPNGNYTASLVVTNQYNLVSATETAAFAMNLPAVAPPTLTATVNGSDVVLNTSGDFATIYILRDGVPIGIVADGVYTDYSANGATIYTARGITADGNFADSEMVSALVHVKGTVLSVANSPSEKINLWLRKGSDTTQDSSLTMEATAAHYAGRALPVVEFSAFADEDVSFAFSLISRADVDNLRSIVKLGNTLLYRDHHGDRFYIAVTSVRFSRDHISTDFTVSAQKVDFVEKIDY